MTLYHVPHMALGAELSDDYVERTSVVQYRTFSAMVGALGIIAFGIYFFFPKTPEYANGLLNPAGYPAFARFSAIIMFVTIWYSAWGTRKEIPHLPKAPEHPKPFSVRDTFGEFALAWKNHSFRSLFVGFSLFAISISVGTTLGTHVNVFFWEFTSAQIASLIAPTAGGFVIGVAASAVLHQRFDKKPTLIASALVSTAVGQTPVVLRLLGLLPENGGPAIYQLAFGVLFAVGAMAGIAYTSAGSMMADVAQDQFLKTGKNQQGILFSAVAFSGKLGSAGGHLLAGVGIDLMAFPLRSEPAEVAPELIARLGILSLIAFPLALAGLYAYTRYQINRASYEASMRALAEARVAQASP